MDARTFLEQIRINQHRVEQLNQMILETQDSMEAMNLSCPPDKEKVQGGYAGDSAGFTKYVDEMVDKIERMQMLREVLFGKSLAGKEMILKLEDTSYRQLLWGVYVEGKQLKELEIDGISSYDWIRRIHGRALKYFERSYPDILFLPDPVKDIQRLLEEEERYN